jgi:hypothetical protein
MNKVDFREIVKVLESKYNKNFRQDEPNHWRFEVKVGEGRSQVVHLLYKEKKVSDIDVSRIIVETPIGPVHRHLNFEFILRKNTELDVGALCIHDLKNEENLILPYLTLRGTHLVPTADLEEVFEMIEKVAKCADSLEMELFATDFH